MDNDLDQTKSQDEAGTVARVTERPLLEVQHISKFFPGVQALRDVNLSVHAGEIHALIGENGAGKSTLMNVIGGVFQPDAGSVFVDGKPVVVDSVQKATALGIAFVHQELNLLDNLDVAANVFLGREPRVRGLRPFIDRQKICAEAERVLSRIDLKCDVKVPVRDLSVGTKQMIEIAKALSMNARVFILDEPTSSLSQTETHQLFSVLRELQNQDVGIIYISHRLGEVQEVANRVTVLRDGVVSGHLGRDEIEYKAMISLMVGRDVEKFYHHEHIPNPETVLEVKDLVTQTYPRHANSFSVRRGEILVFAGLVGAGRTELVHALFGIDEPLGGRRLLDGEEVDVKSPQDAIRHGIGLVPEDRKLHGLILEMAMNANITLSCLNRIQSNKMIDFKKVDAISDEMVETLNIKPQNIRCIVESLSGGNQQKVVLAKWLSLRPRLLILDEPTRGIDVVSKEEIYRLMERLCAEGVSMLVVSSEMQEVLGIADRVIVMHEGKISGELQKKDFSEENVVKLSTGGAL